MTLLIVVLLIDGFGLSWHWLWLAVPLWLSQGVEFSSSETDET